MMEGKLERALPICLPPVIRDERISAFLVMMKDVPIRNEEHRANTSPIYFGSISKTGFFFF